MTPFIEIKKDRGEEDKKLYWEAIDLNDLNDLNVLNALNAPNEHNDLNDPNVPNDPIDSKIHLWA